MKITNLKQLRTIAVATIIILSSIIFLYSTADDVPDNWTNPFKPANNQSPNTGEYKKSIIIDQDSLKLDHEVIQYSITFHEDDTIDVKVCIGYISTARDNLAYQILLTDGEKILGDKESLGNTLMYNPAGTVLDITTARNHFMLGGRFIHKILPIGQKKEIKDSIRVEAGDVWYLTMAVYKSIEEELSVSLESSASCMELVEIERNSNIGFYSAWDNEFSGRYIGVRIIPFLPFGFSYCRNINKRITTERGSVVTFSSVGHLLGKISVAMPSGETYNNNNRNYATYHYLGNETGDWVFTASGIGFPFKHSIILFYVDIDPHVQ